VSVRVAVEGIRVRNAGFSEVTIDAAYDESVGPWRW
jgi:hypothetical protein